MKQEHALCFNIVRCACSWFIVCVINKGFNFFFFLKPFPFAYTLCNQPCLFFFSSSPYSLFFFSVSPPQIHGCAAARNLALNHPVNPVKLREAGVRKLITAASWAFPNDPGASGLAHWSAEALEVMWQQLWYLHTFPSLWHHLRVLPTALEFTYCCALVHICGTILRKSLEAPVAPLSHPGCGLNSSLCHFHCAVMTTGATSRGRRIPIGHDVVRRNGGTSAQRARRS
jgi:hypothetical protein